MKNMEKKIKRSVLFPGVLAILVLLCGSCMKEPFRPEGTDGVNLRLSLVTADEKVVDTRSGTDDAISNVYVLVFNGNTDDAKIIDWAEGTTLGEHTYYAALKDATTSGYVYILANVATNIAGGADLSKLSTLGEVRSKLIVQLRRDAGGNIIEDPNYSPMTSPLLDYSGANALKTAGEVAVTLKRATARVTVVNGTGDTKFSLQGANMGNAPSKGYVFENIGSITDAADLGHYAGLVSGTAYSLDNMMRGMSSADPLTTEPLYVFESPQANQSFVIVKCTYRGVTGYHRLDLWDGKDFLDVKRNYKYVITVRKIATAGYATARQAMDGKPTNRDINYDITVTDPFSHDIVTNGEQYLGVSNSSLVVYRTGALSNVLATVLNYTIPTDIVWSPGSITAVGDGLTFSGGAKSMPLSVASTTDMQVSVNFTEKFTSGSLVIHIGDLSKVIQITRHPNLGAVADEMVFPHAGLGDRSTGGDIKSSIRFSGTSGVYPQVATSEDLFDNEASDTLYTLISANIGYKDNVSERSGEFYVTSAQDEGRTKVMFYQEKMDVYTQLVQLRPYTYVGVYYRADQTAERIIRIKPLKVDPSAIWSAVVVVGQDFIELDTHDSKDPGIHSAYPYGYDESDPDNTSKYDNAQWTSDADVEANCQFTRAQKGKSVVSGKGDKIFFRVGLKSQLATGAAALTAQPRYGLIALIHQHGTHLIYVRQGECEDYLMRQSDPIDEFSVNRGLAVKMLPYNITVPPDKMSLKQYDVPVNGGALTQYPSQGGYIFQGTSRRAYYPVGKASDAGWKNNSNINTGGTEVCPPGYRRPADGPTGTSGEVLKSEMRQSFWLKPKNGKAQSNYDNMLRGYLADGYFDRRPIRVPNTQGHTDEGQDVYSQEPAFTIGSTTYGPFTVPTMVGEGAEVAFAGMLLYNPYTYASVFVPGTGSRFGQFSFGALEEGRLIGTGAQSNLWTSTISGGSMWYLATGYYLSSSGSGSSFVFDNYQSIPGMEGFSVRCVRDI